MADCETKMCIRDRYFAERPARQLSYQEVSVWQRLAEKQVESGKRKSASGSYVKASLALGRIDSSANIYLFDIQSAVRLGESMLQNLSLIHI